MNPIAKPLTGIGNYSPWMPALETQDMRKLKNEQKLTKEAVRVGMIYAEDRGAAVFEPTDGRDDKAEYVYRLLVHDNMLQPLAKNDESLPNMRHKLALWIARKLPANHPLLKD